MPLPRKTEHKMLNEFVPKVTLLRPLDPEGKTSMKLKTVQMLFEMIEIKKKVCIYIYFYQTRLKVFNPYPHGFNIFLTNL